MPNRFRLEKRISRGMAVLRILTGLLMAIHGLEVFSPEKMNTYLEWDSIQSLPFPSIWVYLGKSGEFITGLFLCFGFFTRSSALIMAIILFFICFYIGQGKFWYEDQHPFIFGLLALAFSIYGPGAFAVDHKLKKSK